jgi:aspartate/methionine/tyrosine aminotransferase
MRCIPASGINLFQLIYILIREYKEKSGLEPLNLSLGNPDGVPDARLLDLQARFAADPAYELHTYAEDKNLNSFCEGMVMAHCGLDITKFSHLKAVSTAGIKSVTSLVPLACGLHLPDGKRRESFRVVTNLPAYDVMGTWATSYLNTNRIVWPLLTEDNMRLKMSRLKAALEKSSTQRPDLIFVIRPGNPAAVGATPEEWRELIEFCIQNKTRLVNDGAYTALAGAQHTALSLVAKDYPELEWLELFSVSKSFNDPGARLGVAVGSKDFVEDLTLVKGNTDSGPVPSVMWAYGEFFKDQKTTQAVLSELRSLYEKRLAYVIGQLRAAGLKQACDTDAGFFTLWKSPTKVFGINFKEESEKTGTPLAELVNRKIISETGIVGVHFTAPGADGKPEGLLRYAVCTDVLASDFQKRFEKGLAAMSPSYD